MAWTIKYDERALKDLKKLDKPIQRKIVDFFDNLSIDPHSKGKPLKANFSGLWRYRIGNYRAVCRLEDDGFIVLVLRVAHRKNIYDKAI